MIGAVTRNPTAGAGDPYWYEWAVGLRYVVAMLDPDSGIVDVNFQASGEKGFDDVVVSREDGAVIAIQVKHTRSDDTLTLGDLVGHEEGKMSLLRALADAWNSTRGGAPSLRPVLYTNRRFGTSAASTRPKSGGGIYRPALSEFWPGMKRRVDRAKTLQEVAVEDRWKPAWAELMAELGGLPDDTMRREFLGKLELRAGQPSLGKLEEELREALVRLFHVIEGAGKSLLERLFASLRHWTLAHSAPVTREAVYEVLSATETRDIARHQLPPPTPFFESRNDLVQRVDGLLDGHASVVFLTGPPGSGKTSVVSHLANRREPRAQLRFHAFRPIDPNNPVLPSDADRGTSSEALWFDLLAQLRDQLRGQLAHYRVPVQSEYLSATKARSEVLRVAGEWAAAAVVPVTIAIDGIDHAARAQTPGASEFLRSLVPPDEVPQGVCFLIAGQDPVAYDYPVWLSMDERVVRIDLPALRDLDVESLLRATPPPYEHLVEGLARTINAHAQGNTLSVLFSIQEAMMCGSIEELEPRLASKRMTPALDDYYGTIWARAMEKLVPLAGVQIAAALCLLRGRINGEVLSRAFTGVTEAQWSLCLENLRPLVVQDGSGYRVLHNDVAVYLHRLLRTREGEVRILAGQLADYLLGGNAPRQNVHASVFDLLRLAGRAAEHAPTFTVEFVQEAWELNRPYGEVEMQALDAMESALQARDWSLIHQVACATQSAYRISSCASFHELDWPRTESPHALQKSIPSELAVPPMRSWTREIVASACSDIRHLAAAGEVNRARAVVERWFGGLSARDILAWRRASDKADRFDDDVESLTELGECLALTRTIYLVAPHVEAQADEGDGDDRPDSTSKQKEEKGAAEEQRADALLVRGMLSYAAEHSSLIDWCRVLRRIAMFFPEDLVSCIHPLLRREAWGHLRALLQRCRRSGDWGASNHCLTTTLGLCIGFPGASDSATQIHKDVLRLVAEASEQFSSERTSVCAALAFIWGWVERAKSPEVIGFEVAQISKMESCRSAPDGPGIVRCAAIAGRALSLISDKQPSEASDAIDLSQLSESVRMLGSPGEHLDEKEGDVRTALLSAFVWVAETLGGEADSKIESALSELAGNAPCGPLGEAIWQALQRRGREDTLEEWCSTWIGTQGRAWSLQVHERDAEVRRFIRLSARLGLSELASAATDLLVRRVASFQLRNDDALSDAHAWFEMAIESGVQDVTDATLALLGLSRMADAVGERTLGSWIESSVYRYLSKCGPQYLLGLWEAPPKGEWLQPEMSDLFCGIIEAAQNHELERSDLRAVWCVAIGCLPVERELNRVLLHDLHSALLASDGSGFGVWSEATTPLEAAVEGERDRFSLPHAELRRKANGEVAVGRQTVADLRAAAMNSDSLSDTWKSLASCIAASRVQGISELDEVVESSLALLAELHDGHPWSSDRRSRVYYEIARCQPDAEHWWEVAEAVIGSARKSVETFRLHVASENLESLCRCVARGSAGYKVRCGLDRQLKLVKSWTGVAADDLVLPLPESGFATVDVSWCELGVRFLLDRFETDDALGVATAIRGLGQLLVLDLTVLAIFVRLLARCSPRAQRWGGYVLEWLAARAPENVASTCASLLEKWISGDDILLAVQAWAVLSQCARGGAVSEPDWPRLSDSVAPTLDVVGPGFLHLPPEEKGGFSFAWGHRAASTSLRRVSDVLGGDVSDLEARANAVRTSAESLRPARERYAYLRLASGSQHRAVLDVVQSELIAGRWGQARAALVGQAVAYGDDPFVLIGRREFRGDVSWELLDQVAGACHGNDTTMKKLVRELIESGVKDEGKVIGGCLLAYSDTCDMHFGFHRRIRPYGSPTSAEEGHTLTPRSFALYDGERYEGSQVDGFLLTVRPGGLYEFMNSSYMVYPSVMLESVLGWVPNPVDPTELRLDGQVVARYEVVQGPFTDRVRDPEYRNPVVGRWVATTRGWAALEGALDQSVLDELIFARISKVQARHT